MHEVYYTAFSGRIPQHLFKKCHSFCYLAESHISIVLLPYKPKLASRIRTELQFRPDPARKLSTNLYDIYHCCVYSDKLLMMDIGTGSKHVEFYSKNKFEKLVHLVGYIVGYIIRIYHDARSSERQIRRSGNWPLELK